MRLNIDSCILNVVWWNLACAGDWGDVCHCSSRLWHMSCWGQAKLLSVQPPTPTPCPPTSASPLSLYLTVRERSMLSFYALHSLLVLSSHCNTAVFQHTNNWDCGGSSLPRRAASHPGVTVCQGTVSLRPQLHSPPDVSMPVLLY